MPRTCTVCAHADREAIDARLVAGDSIRGLSPLFAVSQSALRRHRDKHLPATLAQAQAAAEVAHGDDLLAQVRSLQARSLSILDQAEQSGDLKTALQAIKEARGCLELLAKLLGELAQEGATVNVLIMPEWAAIRLAIVQALLPFPQARAAVAETLQVLDHVGR